MPEQPLACLSEPASANLFSDSGSETVGSLVPNLDTVNENLLTAAPSLIPLANSSGLATGTGLERPDSVECR